MVIINNINFGWREQVDTTSARLVNHIRELKIYNKMISCNIAVSRHLQSVSG